MTERRARGTPPLGVSVPPDPGPPPAPSAPPAAALSSLPGDLAVGLTCTWWDAMSRVRGTTCPRCGGPLAVVARSDWLAVTEEHVQKHGEQAGWARRVLRWSRGRCYRDSREVGVAYRAYMDGARSGAGQAAALVRLEYLEDSQAGEEQICMVFMKLARELEGK